MYPTAGHRLGTREGDSPAILHLISSLKGLNDIADPTMGGWGGRFVLAEEIGPQYFVNFTQGIAKLSQENLKDKKDGFNDVAMTFERWCRDIQNDFQARMDWVIHSNYKDANHNPVASLNGDSSDKILTMYGEPGENIVLDSSGSFDPDNDLIISEWFQYLEAGSYKGYLIEGEIKSKKIDLKIPYDFGKNQDAHIILRVVDNGIPKLVDYKRVIIKHASNKN